MILNNQNEEYFYKGQKYYIGQRIIATSGSEYEGLLGTIVEIRDGEDKVSHGEAPSICCSFEKPQLPYDIEHLEAAMSELYGEPKKLDELYLEGINMAPHMIDSIETANPTQTVYMLIEDWAHNDDHGTSYMLLPNLAEAKKQMRLWFQNELEGGFLSDQLEGENIVIDSSELCYEAYEEGFADAEHYILYIEERQLAFDDAFVKEVFKESSLAATRDIWGSYDNVIACLEDEIAFLDKHNGDKTKEDDSYQFILSQFTILARENKISWSVMEKVISIINDTTKGLRSAYLEAGDYCERMKF